jgi:hypothetical protein
MKFSWSWIAIIDKQRYPLKGIYPVFIQNVLELIFLVGFVWYLSWSPAFVLACCVVEAFALCFFSILKTKSSFGFMDGEKHILAVLAAFSCMLLCAFQTMVFFNLNEHLTLIETAKLLWGDNEFLFCVVAVLLQPYFEFLKYKRSMRLFAADLEITFVNPVLKMLFQQALLLLAMILLQFVNVSILFQAVILAAVWTLVKTLLGQIQVAFIPVNK